MVILTKQEITVRNMEQEIMLLKKQMQVLLNRVRVLEDTQKKQNRNMVQISNSVQ